MNRLWFTTLLTVLLCGCGSKEAPKATIDPKAFDAAAPELKQTWDLSLACAERKDFGAAIMTLRTLSRQSLSQEQQKTIFDTIVCYETKLRETAKGGDPAARKTMEALGIDPNS